MNENKLLGKFYSSGIPEDNMNNSYIPFTNNYNMYTSNYPPRNYSANISRNKISNNLPIIPSPYHVYDGYNRNRLNYTPEIVKIRNYHNASINNLDRTEEENILMNYMKEKMKAIERNIEERRSNDQREIINLLLQSQNNIKINNDHSNDIFRTENIVPQETRKRNNSESLNGKTFIPEEYQNTYYHVPNRSHHSEIMDNKFKKKIEKTFKSQVKLINNNLDKFKEDISNSIKKIIPKKKSNYEILLDEISSLKQELGKKDENKIQPKETVDVTKILDSVKDIKSDISNKIIEESSKNREYVQQIDDRLNNFKSNILTRLENVENYRNNNIKYNNNLTNENAKELINHKKAASPVINQIIKTENKAAKLNSDYKKAEIIRTLPMEIPIVINTKPNPHSDNSIKYFKPKKNEILKILSELNVTKNSEIKLKNLHSRIEIDGYLEKIKTNNDKLKQFLNNEMKDDINLTEWKRSKLKNMKEILNYKFSEEKKQLSKKVKNIVSKISQSTFIMKKINIFRSVVYTVIASLKIEKIFIENKKYIRLESLKTFVNYYESLDCNLQEWVFSSIRIPYLSIYNFENLDLDITTPESILLETYENKYIRLETRLSGFMDHLIEHTNHNEIEQNSIKFLHLITSEYSYIPKEFFFKYELARIEYKDSIVVNLNENQKMLIIAFYVILKILVINIFLENKFSTKIRNQRVKQNYKVISSVFYHTLINMFDELTPKITNKKTIIMNEKTKESKSMVMKSKDNLKEPFLKTEPNTDIHVIKEKTFNIYDKKYEEALKAKNKSIENKITSNKQEMKCLKNIRMKLPVYKDDENDVEINHLKNCLLSKKDLVDYYRLANKNKFNFKEKILIWIKKLYRIIHHNSNN